MSKNVSSVEGAALFCYNPAGGEDGDGAFEKVKITGDGSTYVEPNQLAHERNIGTSNQYGVGVGEWNYTPFNPRAASIGTAVGAAGALGATEVLISANPVLLGGITFESDNAGNALLRDTASTGNSVAAQQLDVNTQYDGIIFNTGLTVTGTATGTAFVVKWRDQ